MRPVLGGRVALPVSHLEETAAESRAFVRQIQRQASFKCGELLARGLRWESVSEFCQVKYIDEIVMSKTGDIVGLPTQKDFDPTGCCLDGNHAWEMFGGLTVEEACIKFWQHPQFYQEDFMFMGGVAFAYYFSVIERYIYEVQIDPRFDDEAEAVRVLAHCIIAQLEPDNVKFVKPILDNICRVVVQVRGNLEQYGGCEEDRQRVDSSWAKLEHVLGLLDTAG